MPTSPCFCPQGHVLRWPWLAAGIFHMLWGWQGAPSLRSLTAPSALSPQKFDELLHLASRGQHTNVDMLVQTSMEGPTRPWG